MLKKNEDDVWRPEEGHTQGDAHIYAAIFNYRKDGLTKEQAVQRAKGIFKFYGKTQTNKKQPEDGGQADAGVEPPAQAGCLRRSDTEPPDGAAGHHQDPVERDPTPKKEDPGNSTAPISDGSNGNADESTSKRKRKTSGTRKKATRKNKRDTPVTEFNLFGEA